jgi:transcriptional regulator with GAF, ATPase, and Fis domain
VSDKKGRVAVADGGTFFLDEVSELSPATQAKLLRFLQEGTYERVGDEKTSTVDVRVISAPTGTSRRRSPPEDSGRISISGSARSP